MSSDESKEPARRVVKEGDDSKIDRKGDFFVEPEYQVLNKPSGILMYMMSEAIKALNGPDIAVNSERFEPNVKQDKILNYVARFEEIRDDYNKYNLETIKKKLNEIQKKFMNKISAEVRDQIMAKVIKKIYKSRQRELPEEFKPSMVYEELYPSITQDEVSLLLTKICKPVLKIIGKPSRKTELVGELKDLADKKVASIEKQSKDMIQKFQAQMQQMVRKEPSSTGVMTLGEINKKFEKYNKMKNKTDVFDKLDSTDQGIIESILGELDEMKRQITRLRESTTPEQDKAIIMENLGLAAKRVGALESRIKNIEKEFYTDVENNTPVGLWTDSMSGGKVLPEHTKSDGILDLKNMQPSFNPPSLSTGKVIARKEEKRRLRQERITNLNRAAYQKQLKDSSQPLLEFLKGQDPQMVNKLVGNGIMSSHEISNCINRLKAKRKR